jgi:ABC-type polysaccharide/polyol phosphate export permease
MSTTPKRRHVHIKAPTDGARADEEGVLFERARHTVPLFPYLREMWERRLLVSVLAGRKLKAEYEMNIVGFAWWLLEPLSLTAVYYVLVNVLRDNPHPDFLVFVLCALLSYKWLAASLVGSMTTVRSNTTLIQDVYFPRALLPVTEVTIHLVHFAVGLLVLPPFMIALSVPFTAHLLWLPLVMAVQLVFSLGIAYFFAVWGLNYRNLPGLIGNLLRLWFYVSPSLWALSDVNTPALRTIIKYNPLTGLFEGYRSAILYGRAPGLTLAWTALVGLIALALGVRYFTSREAQFGKML